MFINYTTNLSWTFLIKYWFNYNSVFKLLNFWNWLTYLSLPTLKVETNYKLKNVSEND